MYCLHVFPQVIIFLHLQNKYIQQGKEPALSPSVDKFKRKSMRLTKHLQSATDEKIYASSKVAEVNLSLIESGNVNKPTHSNQLPPVGTNFFETNENLSKSSTSEVLMTQSDELHYFPQCSEDDKWEDFFTPEVVCQHLIISYTDTYIHTYIYTTY